MTVPVAKHQWTLAAYRRMGETGILSEDDRVELIAGEVVEMTPIGRRHAAVVKRLNRLLQRAVGDHTVISVQDPLEVGGGSEPQPDLAVLRPRADDYAGAVPTAADVLMLIEVAESSLEYDRQVKGPLYARAGIPEYWIGNMHDGVLETYRDSAPGGYRTVAILRPGALAGGISVPGLALAVEAMLV